LTNCPRCGTNVPTPIKTSAILSRRPTENKKQPRLIGLFECPNCKARFRAAMPTETRPEEAASIKNMVDRIKGIKEELMQTLKILRERIKTLETERANLMVEIDKLRKTAESRASALETEVNMLREEAKSLRELLGYSQEPAN
jgi:septal ring factor EnvC (AmiA/AmiB activator)